MIIWCFRVGSSFEMVSDPGGRDLDITDISELAQLDSCAEVKTSSGSGSDGSNVGSGGVKLGWPARKSRLPSFLENSKLY